MKFYFYFGFILTFISCENNVSSIKKSKENRLNTKQLINQKKDSSKIKLDKVTLLDSLVDIQTINSEIQVDLKYASSDNFMKMKLYNRLSNAYLQKDVAIRLSNCQKFLSKIKPGYRLLVYDAVRPVSVQKKMWDALDSLPPSERGKFVSNPVNRSLHNLGAAVDLTIIDNTGVILDMGANYDDIRKIAYPILEREFLASGELSANHIANRELLRRVMKSQGFRPLETEWWHFNACSRSEGKSKYKVLMDEP